MFSRIGLNQLNKVSYFSRQTTIRYMSATGTNKGVTGIMMLNMGGPATLDQVYLILAKYIFYI